MDYLEKIDTRAPDVFDKDVIFRGLPLRVAAHVFDPSKARSTSKMALALDLLPPTQDSRIIELGTGTGALSTLLWLRGCRHIVATDIDKSAQACAKFNLAKYGARIPVRGGDLFDEVPEAAEADYIVFNIPTFHPRRKGTAVGGVSLWDPIGDLKSRFVHQLALVCKSPYKALMMYSRMDDYDSLEHLDLRGFDVSFLLVEKTDDSEIGVLLLSKS